MESILRDKIEKNLKIYFPNQDFIIKKVRRIKTWSTLVLYCDLLEDDGKEKKIFLKKIHPNSKELVFEFLKIKEYWNYLLTPRILDFFVDENMVVYDGIKGNTLSKNMFYYIFQIRKSSSKKKFFKTATKMGTAIGYLQNLTKKRKEKIINMNTLLINRIESNEQIYKLIGKECEIKIKHFIDFIKDLEIWVSQVHRDPTPHNIYLYNDEVYLLDFAFQNGAIFEDPLCFMASLDLMRNRIPFFPKSIISKMKENFYKAYIDITQEHLEEPFLNSLKILRYLELIIMYGKRKKNIKRHFVENLDRKNMLKEIKNLCMLMES